MPNGHKVINASELVYNEKHIKASHLYFKIVVILKLKCTRKNYIRNT